MVRTVLRVTFGILSVEILQKVVLKKSSSTNTKLLQRVQEKTIVIKKVKLERDQQNGSNERNRKTKKMMTGTCNVTNTLACIIILVTIIVETSCNEDFSQTAS